MTQLHPRTGRLRGWARAMLFVLALLPLGCGGPRTSAPVEARTVQDEPPVKPRAVVAPVPEPGGRAAVPTGPREPGDWRPESYVVRKGDTLYSIALDHGLDYRELASWNGVADPNRIHVEQKLTLRAPPGWQPSPEPAATPEVPAPDVVAQPLPPPAEITAEPLAPLIVKTGPKAVKLPYSDAALAQLRGEPARPPAAAAGATPAAKTVAGSKSTVAAPTPAAPIKPAAAPPAPVAAVTKPAATALPNSDASWIWPASGPLLHGFNQGSNPKGVAIGGEPGQAIVASAAGKVVYSGSGLRGYGKLIIIKHNDTYLSVYAHNRTLLVKEGQRVARGQKIAEMGDSDAQEVALHFEIRRLGKPVDPLQYLPQQGA